MKFQIHSVSGSSHQTVANGQPCDRWLVTLQVLATGGKVRNLRRLYYMPVFATKDEAEKIILDFLSEGDTSHSLSSYGIDSLRVQLE